MKEAGVLRSGAKKGLGIGKKILAPFFTRPGVGRRVFSAKRTIPTLGLLGGLTAWLYPTDASKREAAGRYPTQEEDAPTGLGELTKTLLASLALGGGVYGLRELYRATTKQTPRDIIENVEPLAEYGGTYAEVPVPGLEKESGDAQVTGAPDPKAGYEGFNRITLHPLYYALAPLAVAGGVYGGMNLADNFFAKGRAKKRKKEIEEYRKKYLEALTEGAELESKSAAYEKQAATEAAYTSKPYAEKGYDGIDSKTLQRLGIGAAGGGLLGAIASTLLDKSILKGTLTGAGGGLLAGGLYDYLKRKDPVSVGARGDKTDIRSNWLTAIKEDPDLWKHHTESLGGGLAFPHGNWKRKALAAYLPIASVLGLAGYLYGRSKQEGSDKYQKDIDEMMRRYRQSLLTEPSQVKLVADPRGKIPGKPVGGSLEAVTPQDLDRQVLADILNPADAVIAKKEKEKDKTPLVSPATLASLVL